MDFKQELLKTKTIYNNRSYEGADLSQNSFQHKSYKRSTFSRSTIKRSILRYCAFTGSKFYKCNLLIKKLNNNNLQNCYFNDINFDAMERIYASTFDNAVFENCKFSDAIFLSCNFTNAIFLNCNFKNIRFKSSNFDNCLFENCIFNGLEFNYMNIDYSHFKNCEFNNSIMSAFQLPYIYEFKDLINCANNKVMINKKEYSLEYYKDNIEFFLELYQKSNEAFPILNILCLTNKYNEANRYAYKFCREEILNANYLQLKKIITLCNYLGLLNYEKRVDLLIHLNNLTEKCFEIKEYNECRKILLDDTAINEITIDTGLDFKDPCLMELIGELDSDLTAKEKSGFHMIKYSHKSPAILAISFTQIAEIIGVVGGSITIVELICTIVSSFYKRKRKEKKGGDCALPKKVTITKTYDKNGVLKKETEEIFIQD